MIKSLKIIGYATYMNIASYVRVKESFFFSFIFPVFLFILFGFIWGRNYPDYIGNLFLGLIAMTIASDALFSIGPIVRIYVMTNSLKPLKVLPFDMTLHFLGLLFSRFIAILITVVLLVIVSIILFNYSPTFESLVRVIICSIIGTLIFGFLGLLIAFTVSPEASKGVINFLYFTMLFLSGTFYPIDIMPEFLQVFSHFLPLTHLLKFLKGEDQYLIYLIFWFLLFLGGFLLSFRRFSVKR